MNVKISVFLICIEAIMYLLLHNLHDRTFKVLLGIIIFKVVRQLLRQLVYTMVISHNDASFHLWWKEDFVK